MYKIRKFVDNKTLLMIYNSLIYSHLLYAVPIWGNADEVHLKPLLTSQKKAVRLISNKHFFIRNTFTRVHSAPLFNNLNILKIHDIFNVETLKFVFDSLNKLNPKQFHNYFLYPANKDALNTAAIRNENLNTPSIRTVTYGIKSLKYTGSVLWNSLHLPTKNIHNRLQFNKKVKNIYIYILTLTVNHIFFIYFS